MQPLSTKVRGPLTQVAADIGLFHLYVHTGQKCSALSRLYVPKSLWEGEFKGELVKEVEKITIGPVTEFEHFMTPVMYVRGFS